MEFTDIAFALDHIDEGIFFFDNEGKLAAYNQCAGTIFHSFAEMGILKGRTFEDLINQCIEFGEFAGTAVIKEPQKALANFVKRHNKPPPKPWRQRLADGRVIQFREYITQDKGIVTILSDVTDSVQTENRLSDSIDAFPAGFVLWDATDRLVVCNQHYRETYPELADIIKPGLSYKSFLQAGSNSLIVDISGSYEAWIKERLAIRRSPVASHEQWLQNGRCLQINERRTKDGGVVSIEIDITDIKNKEMELQNHVNEQIITREALERQSSEMVQLLEDYAIEKDKAESANLAKSQFLATMSHELRTPLNAILGFSEMYLHQVFGELGSKKYLEYAHDIHKSGSHLLELINDILDMSKIESGKYDLSLSQVDVIGTVDECVRMLSARANESGISLKVVQPQTLPVLNADRRAFKQSILNILTNAVKFTPNGGNVTISAILADEKCTIAITDTGLGMTVEELKQAQEPFVQIKRGEGRSHEGTGLGLPLTKKLIELQSGRLVLESAPGKGTTAKIIFPHS
ncbi:MAG: PAS-domain containing protein [Rhodospirillales bacterium]|nr:PAS-domain containing protein [Rhodospirillales bacterium]